MAITIDGTGTITGISAGGLPDGSITNDDLAGSITDAKLSGTTCKAWVNFNGTGTPAIRASFNVSSITDNGTGDYTVNFTNALTDANYCASLAFSRQTDAPSGNIATNNLTGNDVAPTASALRVGIFLFGTGGKDVSYVNVAIFR